MSLTMTGYFAQSQAGDWGLVQADTASLATKYVEFRSQ